MEHRAFVQDSCRSQGVSHDDRKASGTSTDGSDSNGMEPFDLTPRGKPSRQVDIKTTAAYNEAAVGTLESSEASLSTELPAPVLGRRVSAGTANEHTERPPPKGLADEVRRPTCENVIMQTRLAFAASGATSATDGALPCMVGHRQACLLVLPILLDRALLSKRAAAWPAMAQWFGGCSAASLRGDITQAPGARSVSEPPRACACCSFAGDRLAEGAGGRFVQPVAAMVEHIIGAPYDVFQWGPPKPPCDQARLQVWRCAACRMAWSGGDGATSVAAAGRLLGPSSHSAAAAVGAETLPSSAVHLGPIVIDGQPLGFTSGPLPAVAAWV